jgi:hypothetical protein
VLRIADVSMVVDGLLYLPSVRRLPFGGRDVTEHLRRLLAARGFVIDDLSALQARLGVTAGYHLLLSSVVPASLRKTFWNAAGSEGRLREGRGRTDSRGAISVATHLHAS